MDRQELDMRILVAHASKRGGTEGLARMLAIELASLGHEVDVLPARDIDQIDYDVVIVGGALYLYRWHADARRFVRRHRVALRTRPVWLFSSGPLDDSARTADIPPVRSVRAAMDRVGARGHMTFGGRLVEPVRGLPQGDWRDPLQVADWARMIAEQSHPHPLRVFGRQAERT